MPEVKQLYQLHKIDRAILQCDDELVAVTHNLTNDGKIETAKLSLETTSNSATTAIKDSESLESEIAGLESSISRLQKKLYDGTVSNPKELLNVQAELKMFQNSKLKREDSLLKAMISTDRIVAKKDKLQNDLTKLEASEKEVAKHLVQQKARLQTELDHLHKDRVEACKVLGKSTLSLYEKLRTTNGGLALSEVKQGICQGCLMSLSAQETQNVKSYKLVQCSNCARILYSS